MFDFSIVELFFCGALALIFVGPKDLPKLVAFVASGLRKIRRVYSDWQGAIRKLELEVDAVARTDAGQLGAATTWESLLPDDIPTLPDDYTPGQLSAEEYAEILRKRREVKQEAKERWLAMQTETQEQAQ